MKIQIKLNDNEMNKIESVFAPINAFVKEEVTSDAENPEEVFNMIKRNAKESYMADHKAYTATLKKEDEEYVVEWTLKDIFIDIISEFGNKIARLFVSLARPILELCKDPIMARINELNDDSDEKRVAIVGKEAIPYINAWRSSKSIEHDKAVMFDLQNYVNTHNANDAIEHLSIVLGNEQNTLKYNKAFFIKLYEELESKCDDEVLNDLCNRTIDRLEEA